MAGGLGAALRASWGSIFRQRGFDLVQKARGRVRKAHDVLGWSPTTSLDEGIPKAVSWFKEWRSAHPDENRPFERPQGTDELAHGFKEPARA